jgi:hypothetical protein
MEATTLATFGLTVTVKQTTPSKPGKAPRDVWEVSGMTSGYEDILYNIGGKRWRGAFSFWSDPSEELLTAIQEQGHSSFAERMEGKKERAEERAERYRGYAANAEARSEAAHNKFHSLLDPIPLGQPILIGHHSERRHRRTLERADNALRKACEETDKAKHYKGKAAGVAWNAADKDVGFMHRRLREAEAELRKVERNMADHKYGGWPGATAEQLTAWKLRLENAHQEYSERVTYWKQQITDTGAGEIKEDGLSERDMAKKASIHKDDYIYSDRAWYQVIRVNAKTVTAQCLIRGCDNYKPKIVFAEIEKVITAEEFAADQKRREEAA